MAYGYHLEAEYSDGYTHSEAALNDQSPYVPGRNVFYDIYNHLPVTEHGPLVRFSCIGNSERHDIECKGFPPDAKMIYKRWMHRLVTVDGQFAGEPYASKHIFGYEFHDAAGEKHKELIELT